MVSKFPWFLSEFESLRWYKNLKFFYMGTDKKVCRKCEHPLLQQDNMFEYKNYYYLFCNNHSCQFYGVMIMPDYLLEI